MYIKYLGLRTDPDRFGVSLNGNHHWFLGGQKEVEKLKRLSQFNTQPGLLYLKTLKRTQEEPKEETDNPVPKKGKKGAKK